MICSQTCPMLAQGAKDAEKTLVSPLRLSVATSIAFFMTIMTIKVQQIDDCRWRIPREGAMRTDGLVFASAAMMEALRREQALEQVRNVATLPGIVGPAMAMPDIHWGYGFPIGGVAAFDADEGVVSPGGVGYDINCGVRLLRSDLHAAEIRPVLDRLADALFRNVPSGVGSHRRDLKLSVAETGKVLQAGGGLGGEAGLRRRRRPRPHRGPGDAPGGRPGAGFRTRPGARPRPARHPRQRQPLSRDPAGRGRSTTRRRRRCSASSRDSSR